MPARTVTSQGATITSQVKRAVTRATSSTGVAITSQAKMAVTRATSSTGAAITSQANPRIGRSTSSQGAAITSNVKRAITRPTSSTGAAITSQVDAHFNVKLARTASSTGAAITSHVTPHVIHSLYLPVDVEQLVYNWLATQAEITTITGGRIFTVTPKDPSAKFPYVRFSRIGGLAPQNHPLWIDQPRVQFDCYGGPKKLAWQLAATIQALLSYRITGTHPEGVVSGVQLAGLIDQPDDVFDPPQPRYIVDAVITTHPIPD